METIDPGHQYLLTYFDGPPEVQGGVLTFVKRNDPPDKYPGNTTAYPGTQIQEVLRALVSRVQYVNNQVPCEQTSKVEDYLLRSIWLLEERHCERHGRPGTMDAVDVGTVDTVPFCQTCGHIMCFCNPEAPEFYWEKDT